MTYPLFPRRWGSFFIVSSLSIVSALAYAGCDSSDDTDGAAGTSGSAQGGAGSGGAGAGGAGAAGAGAGGAGAGGAGAGGAGAGGEGGGGQGGAGNAGSGGGGADSVKVTDGPLPSGAKCQPIGVWQVTWGEGTESGPSGWCSEPYASNVEVFSGDGGALYVKYGATTEATLSNDGCHLTAKSSYKQTNPSEYWFVNSEVDLTIEGDSATGTYKASNTGFCVRTKTGPATAARVK